MKKYALPLGLLAGILLLSLWNGAAMGRVTEELCTSLTQCSDLGRAENWESAAKILEKTYQDWSHHQVYLHIVLQHDAVDGAEAMFHRAMAFAKTQEPSEFSAELAGLISQLHLLAEMEQLSVRNIL